MVWCEKSFLNKSVGKRIDCIDMITILFYLYGESKTKQRNKQNRNRLQYKEQTWLPGERMEKNTKGSKRYELSAIK